MQTREALRHPCCCCEDQRGNAAQPPARLCSERRERATEQHEAFPRAEGRHDSHRLVLGAELHLFVSEGAAVHGVAPTGSSAGGARNRSQPRRHANVVLCSHSGKGQYSDNWNERTPVQAQECEVPNRYLRCNRAKRRGEGVKGRIGDRFIDCEGVLAVASAVRLAELHSITFSLWAVAAYALPGGVCADLSVGAV